MKTDKVKTKKTNEYLKCDFTQEEIVKTLPMSGMELQLGLEEVDV